MSAQHQVQAEGGKVYTVVDDFTSVYRAVITGVVADEILGEFSADGLSIQVDRADLVSKVTNKGLFAITGYAERSFPNLSTVGSTVNLVAGAPGFRDLPVAVAIPSGSSFPISAPHMALRRNPVNIKGRVVRDTANRLPIAGARIDLVDNPGTPPALHTIVLRSPLLLPHAAATTIREITMSVFGGALLTSEANSGTTILNLSTRAGLVPNSILRLANPAATRVEYAIVDSLGPGAGAGSVILRQALNSSFSSTTAIQFLNPGPIGASATLGVDAGAGDGLLMAPALLGGNTLEIDPGTGSVEYHETGALTDGDGYYGIDGVGRVPEVFFQASHAGFTSKTRDWFLDYGNPVNIVDFRL